MIQKHFMIRVTSIGEILFDVYPKLRTLGGASFNFIYHYIKLTGQGNFVSRIGEDDRGQEILDFISKNQLPVNYIQTDPVHPTGESIAILDQNKIPSWKIKSGTAYDYIELEDELLKLIKENTDCLYFGTLAQRNIRTRETIHHFFGQGLKYFCDLNIRQNFYTEDLIRACIEACDVLKLNIEELHLVNTLLLNNNFDSYETPKRLMNEYSIRQLCVTHGGEGAVIYEGDRNSIYKLVIEDVIDTVGAGDAYAAILCIGYLKGWDIEKTNETASNFAGEIVKINGALPEDSSLYDKYKEIVNE